MRSSIRDRKWRYRGGGEDEFIAYAVMRPSVKNCAEESNRGISAHFQSLQQRLNHAINLGSLENGGKWQCSDIELQRLALRSMDAFIKCISSDSLRYPDIKGSVNGMIGVLQSILEMKNLYVLISATDLALKISNTLPSSVLQAHVVSLICPLAALLSSEQLKIATTCATSISVILSKMRPREENQVWEILKEARAVFHVVCRITHFNVDSFPIECFVEMAHVLSEVLWRWPSCRFSVYNDSELLNTLDRIKLLPNDSVKVAVLQLYSSLALCCCGSEKLLENEEVVQMMVECMSSSTDSVRMEAFKLAKCLALGERTCRKLMNTNRISLVKAVIGAMEIRTSPSEKLRKTELTVTLDAYVLAARICSMDDYGMHFLKHGIVEQIFDLFFHDCAEIHQRQGELSIDDLVIIVRKSYDLSNLLCVRSYVWDILGALTTSFSEALQNEIKGNESKLKTLIICACVYFVDLMGSLRHASRSGSSYLSSCKSVSRAILKLLYSPLECVASFTSSVFGDILVLYGKDYVEHFLKIINIRSTEKVYGLSGDLQVVVSLISLACYCRLPEYRELIIQLQGLKILTAFIISGLKTISTTKRVNIAPHLHNLFSERSCCHSEGEDWEGEDSVFLFGLWVLAELLRHSSLDKENLAELSELREICRGKYSPGVKWYAAYVLSFFGIFGFPSELGNRIGKSLREKAYADMKLHTSKQVSIIHAHQVVLAARCPSLLPTQESRNAVHLSSRVDHESLVQLLEYVYSGCIQMNGENTRNLKILAKNCKLESLNRMLSGKRPIWGVGVPTFDLTPALGSAGAHSWDLILEVRSSRREVIEWRCERCSICIPHMHVHKVIVSSCCNHLHALLQSGMQESQTRTVAVPVSWESLKMLVTRFYSGQLPTPVFNCSWHNSDALRKVKEIEAYIELCWLGEYWLIDDLRKECREAAVSCLASWKDEEEGGGGLPSKLMQLAAQFSQWELVEVAANRMAGSFRRMRDSGELDDVDDRLVEMVRAASVRLSRGGDSCSYPISLSYPE